MIVKSMNKILSILVLICLVSCAPDAPRQGYLRSDALIKLHFNNYQIKDLETVMSFFEIQICGSLPASPESAADCYKAYLKNLSANSNIGEMNLNLPINLQDQTLASIRPVTFDGIWVRKPEIDFNENNNSFALKYGGQYNNFLNAMAKENEAIQQYVDVFNQAGTITPSMIANVLLNYENFDLDQQRGRLFITIHYLTLNKMFSEAEELTAARDSL